MVNDGTLTPGTDYFYQYSPVTTGSGFVNANWNAIAGATGYEVSVGTTAGGNDVSAAAMVGNVTSTTVDDLSLSGAWAGTTTYYVSVAPICTGSTPTATSSNGVRIAEAAMWDGTTTALRAPDSVGGYTTGWPEAAVNAVYGTHYFETVDVGAGTSVLVQGWGKVANVQSAVSATDPSVVTPADGWLEVQANII